MTIEKCKIAGCEIIQTIAEGGSAIVYKAFNAELEAFKAIKIMKAENKQQAFRFLTEAKLTANLNHPNIIQVHSYGTLETGEPYIEMEYLDGEDLNCWMKAKGKVSEDAAICIILTVLKALKYAYSKTITIYNQQRTGLIHRDIKPANILISSEGDIKLTDFGVAKIEELSMHTATTSALVGTSWYLSPEQLRCEELDPRTDIYSLGCTFYEILTGTPAYPYDSIGELVLRKEKNSYNKELLKKICSKSVFKVVEKMMRADKNERYGNVDEIINDLREELKKRNIQEVEEHFKSCRSGKQQIRKQTRSFNATPLIIAGIVVLTAGAAVFIVKNSQIFNTTESNTAETTSQENNSFTIETLDNAFKPLDSMKTAEVDTSAAQPPQSIIPEEKKPETPVKSEATPVQVVQAPPTTVPKPEIKKTVAAVSEELTADDAVSLFRKGRYSEVIQKTKNTFQSNDTLYLLRCGAFLETEQYDDLAQILFLKSINNGYHYYLKGRFFGVRNQIKNADEMLSAALVTRSIVEIRAEALYHQVLMAEKMFESNPTAQNKQLLDSRANTFISRYCTGSGRENQCTTCRQFIQPQ